MKNTTKKKPINIAFNPFLIESAPSEGPIVLSSRYKIEAGSEPDLNLSAKSLASS